MKKTILLAMLVTLAVVAGCSAAGKFDGTGEGSVNIANPFGSDSRPALTTSGG